MIGEFNFEEEDDNIEFLEKDDTRGQRRKKDAEKAMRKRRLAVAFGRDWYDNLHEYSKGKIHCSCIMCAFNGKRHGRIVFKSETAQDRRNRERLEAQFEDFSWGGGC